MLATASSLAPETLTGCAGCPNRTLCARLKDSLDAVGDIPAGRLHRSALRQRESMRRFFAYPRVADQQACWLHDKWGVVSYLAEHAEALARRCLNVL